MDNNETMTSQNPFIKKIYECEVNNSNELKITQSAPIFPPNISRLTNLRSLHLEKCGFPTVPREIQSLTNLERMHISYSEISTMPSQIGMLISLRSLSLEHNFLTWIPEEIGNLSHLTHLNLDQFQIVNTLHRPKKAVLELPEQITKLSQLQVIKAKGYVTRLDRLMGKNNSGKNLKMLVMAHNKLKTLPDHISNLISLTDLNINHNKIIELPSSISDLHSLKILTLRYNQLKTLPSDIGLLNGLESLEITQKTAMESIPKEIKNLSNLTRLIIRAGITELPEIANMPRLNTLIVNDNNIKILPRFNNSDLVHFEAENNQIEELTDDLGSLSKVEYISVKNNRIHRISNNIAALKSLSYFDISKNQLTMIPNEIILLHNLKVIKADTNQIRITPDNIGDLIQLELLWLSWNNLLELPESLGKLTNLRQLLVSNNQLTTIPIQISQCKAIITLDVRNNTIKNIPKDFDQIRGKESAILIDKDVQYECKTVSVRSTGYYDFNNKFDLYDNVLRK